MVDEFRVVDQPLARGILRVDGNPEIHVPLHSLINREFKRGHDTQDVFVRKARRPGVGVRLFEYEDRAEEAERLREQCDDRE